MLVPARHCQPACHYQALTGEPACQPISALWPVALAGGSKHEARTKEDSSIQYQWTSLDTSFDNVKR
jgi:hypothetical protein